MNQAPTPDLAARYPSASPSRLQSLTLAQAAGVSPSTLDRLAAARRLARYAAMTLPPHHYEGLSRGKGWCRKGRGDAAEWGQKNAAGDYQVGPGTWTVGGDDGFSRKGSTTWKVEHVQVGDATWTIAN